MSAVDPVTVTIGSVAWGGWKAVRISSSLDQGAADFEVELTERYPGESNPIRVRPGASCVVRVGDDAVVTGYVDVVELAHDARSRTLRLVGRSKVGDLIDCSAVHEPGTFRKRTVLQIATALAEPYGVTVTAEVDVGDPLPRFRLETGEPVYTAIERAARIRGLIVTDNAAGALVLTRVGTTKASGALTLGENILASAGTFRADVRFSEYRCKGQVVGDDETNGEAASHPSATATDPGLDRTRVLVIVPERGASVGDCRTRARFEAALRAGQSTDVTVTVNGWRQPDGSLWTKGQRVPVTDAFLSLDQAELLVASVDLQEADGGRLTRLRLVPPEAYAAEPLKSTQPSSGGGGSVGLWSELAAVTVPTTTTSAAAPSGAAPDPFVLTP